MPHHSQGALNCRNTTIELANNTLVFTVEFQPTSQFVGVHGVYSMSRDRSDAGTDFQKFALWTVIQ
jgi:hypothetical protein